MAYLFRNNVSTTINDSNGIGTGDTVITVTDGTIFPSPSLGSVRATLVQLDSSGNEQAVEIVTITGVSGNDLTVTRAQESTAALTFSNGDLVEMRLTRQQMENLSQIDEARTFTAAQRGEVTTLTSTSNSIAINLADSNNFSHTLTENTTLAAPSNAVEGQSGVITIIQDATTARTLAYNTFWEFEGGAVPAISTTLSSRSTFVYYVDDGGATATCNLIGPVS